MRYLKILIISLFFFPLPVLAVPYEEEIRYFSSVFNVDWRLLAALAEVESGFNASAINKRDPSYGLMQILCMKKKGGGCRNKFNIHGWEVATPEILLDARTNLFFAAQILAWNVETYGVYRGIAVYNNWQARFYKENFPNQQFVNAVYSKYKRNKRMFPNA